MNLLEVLGIMGANTMSKIGMYVLDELEKHNVVEINDLLERSNNENSEY